LFLGCGRLGEYDIVHVFVELDFKAPDIPGKVGIEENEKITDGILEMFMLFTPYRIIEHLKLTFVAAKPPPPEIAFQELLMAADPPVDYFSSIFYTPSRWLDGITEVITRPQSGLAEK